MLLKYINFEFQKITRTRGDLIKGQDRGRDRGRSCGCGRDRGRGKEHGVQDDRAELVELASISTRSQAFP